MEAYEKPLDELQEKYTRLLKSAGESIIACEKLKLLLAKLPTDGFKVEVMKKVADVMLPLDLFFESIKEE